MPRIRRYSAASFGLRRQDYWPSEPRMMPRSGTRALRRTCHGMSATSPCRSLTLTARPLSRPQYQGVTRERRRCAPHLDASGSPQIGRQALVRAADRSGALLFTRVLAESRQNGTFDYCTHHEDRNNRADHRDSQGEQGPKHHGICVERHTRMLTPPKRIPECGA